MWWFGELPDGLGERLLDSCTHFNELLVLINMSDKLSQLFKEIRDLEPSSGLERAVLVWIEAEKSLKIRRKRIISVFGLAFSGTAAAWAGLTFGNEILQSEFWKLVSLAFSDLGIVLANWKDFSYSLLEAFPAVYVAVIIAPIFTLFLSISSYLNNHNHSRHYNTI